MSESRLPVVSGRRLIRWLNSLGYQVVRQRGSHVRLERRSASGTHALTIPSHYEIAKGTLNDIIGSVARATNQDKFHLIHGLSEF